MLEIRPLLAHQWSLLKSVRLKALADAPEAFSTTLAQAQSWSDEEWERRAIRFAANSTEMTRIAFWNDAPCGMIGCYMLAPPHIAASSLAAVWVDPQFRGRGVGEALVDAAVEWSRNRGVGVLQAWVTERNDRAVAFYERAGFVRTEQRQPYAPDAGTCEVLLLREVEGTAGTSGFAKAEESQ